MALAVSSRAFSGPSAALSRNRAQQQRARVARVRAPITLVAPRAYYGGCNPGGYGSSEQQARILREFMKQLQEQGSASFSWPGGRVWLGADWRDMGDMRSWDDDLASRMGATKDEAARQLEPWKLPVDLQQQADSYILTADVPGVAKEDLTIKLVPSTKTPSGKQQPPAIQVKGTRKSSAAAAPPAAAGDAAEARADDVGAGPAGSMLLKERRRGDFERKVELPDDAANTGISARVKDGVLTVRIPRVQQPEQQESEIPIV